MKAIIALALALGLAACSGSYTPAKYIPHGVQESQSEAPAEAPHP